MYNVKHNVINNAKLPKVGSKAIVPVPCGGRAQQTTLLHR